MSWYTKKDAAKDTKVSVKEASKTWHQAREDARKSGEISKKSSSSDNSQKGKK